MPADLVEADEEDVAADPQHRERADERDGREQARHRGDEREPDALGGLGGLLREVEADVVHLHDQRDHAVDEEVIRTATTASTIARIQMLASASELTTSLSAITMISALRMKSVRMALAMVRFSCSGVNSPCSDTSSVGLGRVPGEALVDLVGALVGEERATEDEDHRQQARQELPEQHGRGQDEEQLVAQRPDGDLLDDRQLAVGRGPVEVLRRHGGVVDDHARGLGAGPARGGADVVHAGGGDPGECGDVVEEGEQSAGHG